MRVRLLVCLIMVCTLLTSCGNSKSDAKYEELKAEYKELLEEYEILEQEQKNLESQFDQLVTEKEMMQLMLNAQGNGNKVEKFEEEKKQEAILGVEFYPVYENASIQLSETAKELLQKSYHEIEAIDEYKGQDVVYDVGTFFGSRDWDIYYMPGGKFKYGLTNVIIGEEAIRLQQYTKKAINYDTTNETLVCLEFCIALEEEYTLKANGNDYIRVRCNTYNNKGDDSSKKTRSFHSDLTADRNYLILINKPVPGKVCVVYQFFSMPVNTKEFIVFNSFDHIGVKVEEWK